MPVYNVENYLGDCLESALSQSLRDIEIICINDGSTDSSLEILQKYAAKDNRITIIDKPNAGYGAAMNDGLKVARGGYIGILESDDRVCQDAWLTLYAAAQDNNLDLIRGNYIQCKNGAENYFSANTMVDYTCPDNLRPLPLEKVFKPLEYPRCFWINPSIWTGLYRREFLERNGIFFSETPGASYQDTGFAFKTWAMAERAMLTEIPVIYYTMDNESSSSKSRAKVYAVCDEMDECERYLDSVNADSECREILSTIRYKTYDWNRKRIANEFKKEFDARMWNELEGDYRSGLCNPIFFRRSEYEFIEQKSKHVPTVIVIVPIDGEPAFLAECLTSLSKQTIEDLRVMCVCNDISSRARRLLIDHTKQDARFEILETKRGVNESALLSQFKLLDGTYLFQMNGNDSLAPNALSDAASLAKRHDLDMVLFRAKESGTESKDKASDNGIVHLLESNQLYSVKDILRISHNSVDWVKDSLIRMSSIALYPSLTESHEICSLASLQNISKTERVMVTKRSLITHRIAPCKASHASALFQRIKSILTA